MFKLCKLYLENNILCGDGVDREGKVTTKIFTLPLTMHPMTGTFSFVGTTECLNDIVDLINDGLEER
jgi:hypothetical protein